MEEIDKNNILKQIIDEIIFNLTQKHVKEDYSDLSSIILTIPKNIKHVKKQLSVFKNGDVKYYCTIIDYMVTSTMFLIKCISKIYDNDIPSFCFIFLKNIQLCIENIEEIYEVKIKSDKLDEFLKKKTDIEYLTI